MIGSRFRSREIYEALNAHRQARGLTWSRVAEETGVSESTLTGTRRGGRLEVDGALAMVRWLGRTIESFAGPTPSKTANPDTDSETTGN